MKVKKLEKRIIEITGDESFELKSKEYYQPLADIYEEYLSKVARLNDIKFNADTMKFDYHYDFTNECDLMNHEILCESLVFNTEKERKPVKLIALDLLNELFVNQDLYNIVEEEMPHLEEILCYLYKNRKAKKIVKDIMKYLSEWLDEIEEEDTIEIYIFSLIDYKLGLYYEYNILPLLQKAYEI